MIILSQSWAFLLQVMMRGMWRRANHQVVHRKKTVTVQGTRAASSRLSARKARMTQSSSQTSRLPNIVLVLTDAYCPSKKKEALLDICKRLIGVFSWPAYCHIFNNNQRVILISRGLICVVTNHHFTVFISFKIIRYLYFFIHYVIRNSLLTYFQHVATFVTFIFFE